MTEKSKCYSDVMKKHFNKERLLTKKDNVDFECSNFEHFDGGDKVRDHCHIAKNDRVFAHRD